MTKHIPPRLAPATEISPAANKNISAITFAFLFVELQTFIFVISLAVFGLSEVSPLPRFLYTKYSPTQSPS